MRDVRFENEYLLSMSKSAGETYCVPEIHCRFEMVGRGGISACGLNSLSSERVLKPLSATHSVLADDEITVVAQFPKPSKQPFQTVQSSRKHPQSA